MKLGKRHVRQEQCHVQSITMNSDQSDETNREVDASNAVMKDISSTSKFFRSLRTLEVTSKVDTTSENRK